jgi:DNA modification methylase
MLSHKINHADIKDWASNYDGPLFDGILCDPPYELGFMGKSWDSSGIAFDTEMWADLFKLVKPGGHLLAFSGSRTYHRMAVAIEDAGFEIRDMIEWVYGSGFPKSLNIGKAVDKITPRLGMFDKFAEHFKQQRLASGKSQKEIATLFPSKTGGITGCVWNWENGANVPTTKQWAILQPLLDLSDEFADLIERVERERELVGTKTTNKTVYQRIGQDNESGEVEVTKGNSPYEGYGTALKPAHEPCVLARKPIEGTVANNVLKHGTGGLNIDGTRVGVGAKKWSEPKGGIWSDSVDNGATLQDNPLGRFPANLIHDGSDEVEAVFPQTKKETSVGANTVGQKGVFSGNVYGKDYGHQKETPRRIVDNGTSASRFFYTAKASKSERNAGLEGFEEKDSSKMSGGEKTRPDRLERGLTNHPTAANHHPTVKPLSLTKYLATLIKPPTGGRLLVPFSGSGSEMIGALQAGWEYVEGVELTEEYIPIAEARIKYWLGKMDKEQLNLL